MESAKSRAACRTFPERQRAKGWSPEASEGRHHLERMQSAPEPGAEALYPLLADIMGGPEGAHHDGQRAAACRRLPGEGRRPSPETERAPRGPGRSGGRTGAGRSGGGPLADGTTAQGTTTAARHKARQSGGPGRTDGGPGLSRSMGYQISSPSFHQGVTCLRSGEGFLAAGLRRALRLSCGRPP